VLLETDQTLAEPTNLENLRRYYFRVTSVDAEGVESDFSNEQSVTVFAQNTTRPGTEMVVNGDFSQGTVGWTWELQGGQAQWSVTDGTCHFVIASGGD
jgi:fibronectin type 3 domain-containing protein